MRFGVQPLFHRAFTTNAGWLSAFARMAEAAGAESIWTVEHPVIAEDYEKLYSYSADGSAPFGPDTIMPDPLELLAFIAGVTSKIRLGTGILVLPLHSPIIIAKRISTIDALSGGRMLLGIGLGWQREEFAAANVPYEERARRTDETIEAMRALWTQAPASYSGKHFNFKRLHLDTKPAQKSVPIIIGGSTEAAARRAGRLGDGFYPYVLGPDDLGKRVELIRATAKAAGRDPDAIEITAWPGSWKPGGSLDPKLAAEYKAAGVTRLMISAHEAGSTDLKDLETFIKKYRDEIAGPL